MTTKKGQVNKGKSQDGSVFDANEVQYFRVIEAGFDPINYFSKGGKLPNNALKEITEQEYLLDRTGKTICYGHGNVIEKVEAKFGWDKPKLNIIAP